MIEILDQTDERILCVKPAGIPSQGVQSGAMPQLLCAQLGCREVFPVHRLDVQTGGVMVYAKTSRAAARLSAAIADGCMHKTYLAIVSGSPAEPEGEWADLLYHDIGKNKTYVVRRPRAGVREAKLRYSALAHAGGHTLIRVQPLTGRTHQIRVQFASRALPLLGDGKYGSREKGSLALWAWALELPEADGSVLRVSAAPPNAAPWAEFSQTLQAL